MAEHKGLNSNAKKITYRLPEYEGDYTLTALSNRERLALLSSIIPLSWLKRHDSLPTDLDTQDKIDAWADKLRLKLMQDIQFCAEMINCINTDTDVQAALKALLIDLLNTDSDVQQAVHNAHYYNNGRFPPNPATTGNILQKADCNKDKAAGFIREGIVDRAVQNIIDMHEILEATTNDEEILDAFIDLIPVGGAILEEIVIFDIPTYVNSIREWLAEQFIAEDTIARTEETCRDLLCLYMQDCSLSVDQIRDYFWKKATEANPSFNSALDTAVDLFNFLINGTIENFDGIWYVMMATQFGFAYFINQLFGMSLETFKILAELGEETNDWIAWEAEYGGCECFVTYDNTTPHEVIYGITGISGVFASSNDTVGQEQIAVTFENIELEDFLAIEVITNRPIIDGVVQLQFVSGNVNSPFNATDSYYVGIDLYGVKISFDPAATEELAGILIRQNVGDNVNDFSFIEFHVYYPC